MPDDVSARLDAVLADLAAEREPAEETVHLPVPMTPRRHRRWAGAVLAAAALTVGGYSLAATGLLTGVAGGSDSGDAVTAEATDDSADALEDGAPGAPGGRDQAVGGVQVEELTSQTLQEDARRLAADRLPVAAAPLGDGDGSRPESDQSVGNDASQRSAAKAQQGEAQQAEAQPVRRCTPPPDRIRGVRTPVTLDGVPATAVIRAQTDGAAVVQVWSCAQRLRLASVLVPSPVP